MIIALCSVILLYILASLAVHFWARRKLFTPAAVEDFYPSDHTVHTPYGLIHLCFIENPNATASVLFSHGNASHLGRDGVQVAAKRIAAMGFTVLAYDYPGYGKSTGKPSPKAILRSAQSAMEFLLHHAPQNKIFLFGRSMGGAPSLWLSKHYKVAGIILHMTFTSIYGLKPGLRFFLGDFFKNAQWIKKLACPLLIIHSKKDPVVPFDHAQTLYKNAPGIKQYQWEDASTHGELTETSWTIFQRFIEEHTPKNN